MMAGERLQPEGDEVVPLTTVMAAAIEIYTEWRDVDAAREAGDLPQDEADAYQEGLLRALERLNARTGVSVAPGGLSGEAAADGRDGAAGQQERSERPRCERCGGEMLLGLGGADPLCPACRG